MQTPPKRQRTRETIVHIRANINHMVTTGDRMFNLKKMHTRQPSRKREWLKLQDRYAKRMHKYESLGVMGWFDIDSDCLGVVMSFLCPMHKDITWADLVRIKAEWGRFACLRSGLKETAHRQIRKALAMFAPNHSPVHLRDLRDAVEKDPDNIARLTTDMRTLHFEYCKASDREYTLQDADLSHFRWGGSNSISWVRLCCLGPSDPADPKWDRHYEECMPLAQKIARIELVQSESEKEASLAKSVFTITSECKMIGLSDANMEASRMFLIVHQRSHWSPTRLVKFVVLDITRNIVMRELKQLVFELKRCEAAESKLNRVLQNPQRPSSADIDMVTLALHVFRSLRRLCSHSKELPFDFAKHLAQIPEYTNALVCVREKIDITTARIASCINNLKATHDRRTNRILSHRGVPESEACACKMKLSKLCSKAKCAKCCQSGCSYHRGI